MMNSLSLMVWFGAGLVTWESGNDRYAVGF